MNIRPATVADEPVLRELWDELEAEVPAPPSFEETWAEEWADVERDIREGAVFLAEDGDGPLGYARAEKPEKRRSHLHAAYVRPRGRRQGVTKALLREVVARVRELGADLLSLDVVTSNADARAVWQRLGFAETIVQMTSGLDELEQRLAGDAGPSSGAVYVQTDDPAKVEELARRYVPRLGRSEATEVTGSANGWVAVRDELCDREPPLLQRLARELSYATGSVVCALGVEHGAVVRYVLWERGRSVDEYLSVPGYYGPVPTGDAIALGANPRVVERLTGADPARVKEVARTAASPAELPSADELRAALAAVMGLE